MNFDNLYVDINDSDVKEIKEILKEYGCVVLRDAIKPDKLHDLHHKTASLYRTFQNNQIKSEILNQYKLTNEYYEKILERGSIDAKIVSKYIYGDEHSLIAQIVESLSSPVLVSILNNIMSSSVVIHDLLNIRFKEPLNPSTGLPMHQDGTGLDLNVNNQRKDDLAPLMLTIFMPFIKCGDDSPGIEVVAKKLEKYYELSSSPVTVFNNLEISDEYILNKYHKLLFSPTLNVGDVFIYSEHTLHRTYITEKMSVARTSADVRMLGIDNVPGAFLNSMGVSIPDNKVIKLGGN